MEIIVKKIIFGGAISDIYWSSKYHKKILLPPAPCARLIERIEFKNDIFRKRKPSTYVHNFHHCCHHNRSFHRIDRHEEYIDHYGKWLHRQYIDHKLVEQVEQVELVDTVGLNIGNVLFSNIDAISLLTWCWCWW